MPQEEQKWLSDIIPARLTIRGVEFTLPCCHFASADRSNPPGNNVQLSSADLTVSVCKFMNYEFGVSDLNLVCTSRPLY